MKWIAVVAATALFGQQKWTFDKDEADKAPAGFEFARTGKGKDGVWVVKKDGDKQVLAQSDGDRTGYRFPLAIVKDSSYKDVTLTVRIKPISGKADQGGGLVWRYQDKDNYYITRLNALEQNVHLYHVVNGKRVKFDGKEEVTLKTGEWHTLKVEAKGDSIKVWLNGEEVISAKDKTFDKAGKIGLWTKADSVMYFDELTAEEIK